MKKNDEDFSEEGGGVLTRVPWTDRQNYEIVWGRDCMKEGLR